MYICTASAGHWEIDGQDGVDYDQEAANVRDWARQRGIATWTGKELWDDLAAYKLTKNAFHHGEPGNPTNITWFRDRIFFRLVMFCLSNMASEGNLAGVNLLSEYLEESGRGASFAPAEVLAFAKTFPADMQRSATIHEKVSKPHTSRPPAPPHH
eukprot:4071808-Heterocapsa_arctica.AAC.1